MRQLNETEKQFLKGYAPKSEMFTSVEEMKEVETKLDLKNNSLRGVRNEVVSFYSELMKIERPTIKSMTTELYWQYMNAMQSVTAVIDNIIYTGEFAIDND